MQSSIVTLKMMSFFFFARHPEAVLWGDARRVADLRRDWLGRGSGIASAVY